MNTDDLKERVVSSILERVRKVAETAIEADEASPHLFYSLRRKYAQDLDFDALLFVHIIKVYRDMKWEEEREGCFDAD